MYGYRCRLYPETISHFKLKNSKWCCLISNSLCLIILLPTTACSNTPSEGRLLVAVYLCSTVALTAVLSAGCIGCMYIHKCKYFYHSILENIASFLTVKKKTADLSIKMQRCVDNSKWVNEFHTLNIVFIGYKQHMCSYILT